MTTTTYDKEIAFMQDLNGPLLISLLLHFGIVAVSMIGLPFLKVEPKPERIIPISIAVGPIDEITQTTEVQKPKPPQAEDRPKPKPSKMDAPKPPDLTKPAPPDIQDPPKDAVPPPPKPEAKPEPEPAPAPKPKPKPKLEPKPEPEQAREEPQEDAFSSLLKNLTPDDPEDKVAENTQSEQAPNDGAVAPLGEQISISEIDAVRQQLAPCWNIMSGAKYAEDLVVEIRAFMNQDGSVARADILDQGRYNRDGVFRSAAESAKRALFNPRCTPLNLPPEKYNQWKTLVIRFDPKDLL